MLTPSPQISYDHGVSDKKLIGETIGTFFDRQVEKYRDREALVVKHQNVRWTWGELGRRVDDLAAGLMTLGLERGDRVGIWSPNTAEWTLTQFATAKAGLVLVNVNPAYRRSRARVRDEQGRVQGADPGAARSRPRTISRSSTTW